MGLTRAVRSGLLWTLCVASTSFGQTTWHVDDDGTAPGSGIAGDPFPTIQAGIDSAVDGDTVLVEPGTYVENVVFLGKAITVRSAQGPAGTLIDGSLPTNPDFGAVVAFSAGEDGDSVLRGFTLTGGTGTAVVFGSIKFLYGGGVDCLGASPSIEGNIVTGNSADFGGGIACREGADATVRGNEIANNSAGANGGGISCTNNASATIVDNEIHGNVSGLTLTGHGGGIHADTGSSPWIAHNDIHHNETYQGGGIYTYGSVTPTVPMIVGNDIHENEATYGAGLYTDQSASPWIVGNLVRGNVAGLIGGGMWLAEDGVQVVNSVVTGNSAGWGGGGIHVDGAEVFVTGTTVQGNSAVNNGGGLTGYNHALVSVSNSILWGNSSPAGAQIALRSPGLPTLPTVLTITYSVGEGGAAAVDVDVDSTLVWGAGMLAVDPAFVAAPAGDLRLTAGSPCIDAGDNTSMAVDGTDLDCDSDLAEAVPLDFGGLVRQVDDPATADTGSGLAPLVDMGAHEFGALLPSDAWTDLGGGSSGSFGVPLLTGRGTLCAGETLELELTGAPPSSPFLAWIAPVSNPFAALGGTVHPFPFTTQLLFATTPSGGFQASAIWPHGVPSGASLWVQFIVQDLSTVDGLILSNGVRATVP